MDDVFTTRHYLVLVAVKGANWMLKLERATLWFRKEVVPFRNHTVFIGGGN